MRTADCVQLIADVYNSSPFFIVYVSVVQMSDQWTAGPVYGIGVILTMCGRMSMRPASALHYYTALLCPRHDVCQHISLTFNYCNHQWYTRWILLGLGVCLHSCTQKVSCHYW